jgi:hypothetical protein
MAGTAVLLGLGAGGYGAVSSDPTAPSLPATDTLVADTGSMTEPFPSQAAPTSWWQIVSWDESDRVVPDDR